MLLMFSVAVPEFLRVTVFAVVVAPRTTVPHVRDVGVRVTAAPFAFTVRLSVVVRFKLPDTPVMVTVTVPVAAVALAVRVSVLLEVAGFGLNPAVTPLGNPEAERVTLSLKPFTGTMLIVLVPLLPWTTVTVPGEALRLKFGVPAQPGKLKEPMAVLQLKPPFCPVAFKYSWVNQKVQSSVGSMVTEP